MVSIGPSSSHGWHAGLRIVDPWMRPHTCQRAAGSRCAVPPRWQTGSLAAVPLWKVMVGSVPTRLRRARQARRFSFHSIVIIPGRAPASSAGRAPARTLPRAGAGTY